MFISWNITVFGLVKWYISKWYIYSYGTYIHTVHIHMVHISKINNVMYKLLIPFYSTSKWLGGNRVGGINQCLWRNLRTPGKLGIAKVVHSRSFAKDYPELTVERGHPNVWGLNAKEKESLTILSFSQFQKFAWCLILNLRHQIPHEC